MLQLFATNTFKFHNIFERHSATKHTSHKSSHKFQTLVSKVKTYEQKRIEKLGKLWSNFTNHGKDDVHHAIKFHEDIFKTFGTENEDDSSNSRSDVVESEVDVIDNDNDHEFIEMDNLEDVQDVQDDSDEYFEK